MHAPPRLEVLCIEAQGEWRRKALRRGRRDSAHAPRRRITTPRARPWPRLRYPELATDSITAVARLVTVRAGHQPHHRAIGSRFLCRYRGAKSTMGGGARRTGEASRRLAPPIDRKRPPGRSCSSCHRSPLPVARGRRPTRAPGQTAPKGSSRMHPNPYGATQPARIARGRTAQAGDAPAGKPRVQLTEEATMSKDEATGG